MERPERIAPAFCLLEESPYFAAVTVSGPVPAAKASVSEITFICAFNASSEAALVAVISAVSPGRRSK